jgi:hypothetical protein
MAQPKTLISIISARHRPEWRQALRETWLKTFPKDKADVFFFVGQGEPIADPEGVVELDCKDDYNSLPSKVQSIVRWALCNGYTHVLKCDDDVILKPKALLDSGYEKHEYSGRSNRPESPYPVTVGFCYWMGRQVMEIISTCQLPPIDHCLPSPVDDERMVGYYLHLAGVKLVDDRRYFLHQYEIAPTTKSRPIRAPKRPGSLPSMWGPQPYTGTVAYCIHIQKSGQEKVDEYYRLYEKVKEQ